MSNVMGWIKTWRQFGPWIAFKVADMLERLGLAQVDFNNSAMFLFDSPREGAELAHRMYGDGEANKNSWAVNYILKSSLLTKELAPPRYERRINCQEAETCLCKWKSHMNGHYEVGEDIRLAKKGLELLNSRTCKLLLAAGVRGGIW